MRMNWFNTSILNKLITNVAFGALAILLASTYAFYKNVNSIDQFEELISKDVQYELATTNLLYDFKEQIQNWKNLLIHGKDRKDRDKFWNEFQLKDNQVKENTKTLITNIESPAAKALIQQFSDKHNIISNKYKEAYKTFISSDFNPQQTDNLVKNIDIAPAKFLSDARGYFSDEVSNKNESAISTAREQARLSSAILVIVNIICSCFILLMTNKSIVTPCKSLIRTIDHISKGELHDIITINREDELGTLAKTSQRLQTFLQNISLKLTETNSSLHKTASELQASTDVVADQASNSSHVAEHVAASMTEMHATSQEVANHAEAAAKLANQADEAATEGVNTMNTAQVSIDHLAKQVAETVETVNQLSKDTTDVGTVLSVIRGIAEQTNLLALNAAIEAARAGEQGRGFAVVADEVRTLAQRTQQSTTEIEQIINNVQDGAKSTVSIMDASFKTTAESAELFNKASDKLNLISNTIAQINDLNSQVSTAAHEQSNVAEDINKTIVEISDMIETTNSSSKTSLTTVETLHTLANEAQKIADSFNH